MFISVAAMKHTVKGGLQAARLKQSTLNVSGTREEVLSQQGCRRYQHSKKHVFKVFIKLLLPWQIEKKTNKITEVLVPVMHGANTDC